eukprot:6491854-Amphidinium_carterae.2
MIATVVWRTCQSSGCRWQTFLGAYGVVCNLVEVVEMTVMWCSGGVGKVQSGCIWQRGMTTRRLPV